MGLLETILFRVNWNYLIWGLLETFWFGGYLKLFAWGLLENILLGVYLKIFCLGVTCNFLILGLLENILLGGDLKIFCLGFTWNYTNPCWVLGLIRATYNHHLQSCLFKEPANFRFKLLEICSNSQRRRNSRLRAG